MKKKIANFLSVAFLLNIFLVPSIMAQDLTLNQKLYPSDAILRFTTDVIKQKDEQGYNLGGWKNGAVVMFPVEISQEGTYSISFEYSRNAAPGHDVTLGVFAIRKPILLDIRDSFSYFYVDLPSTGDSWNNFVLKKVGTLTLPAGKSYIVISDKNYSPTHYVMNLRKLHLDKN